MFKNMNANLTSNISNGKPYSGSTFSSFLIHSRNDIKVILFDEVMYCQAESNYTRIYLCNGKIVMTCKTLKEMEFMLVASQFVRIHASYVVNLNAVRRIIHAGQCSVELVNTMILNVSRSRRKELVCLFEDHYSHSVQD